MSRTTRRLYADQKHHAKERGIDWLLNYELWLEMWLESGKWEQRGKRKGEYQMCRYYDTGPYSVVNCYIGTVEENQKDRHKIPDGQTGEIISYWLTGHFTQYQLGEMFGLDQSSISKIINGKRRSNEIYT